MIPLMKFLHVITAFWFIAGLLGRTVTMWQAARIRDVQMVKTLVQLSRYFENWMVIPGSLAFNTAFPDYDSRDRIDFPATR
jgi:hypothetical protein